MQENEKKQKREPKETPEELQECEMVFADFWPNQLNECGWPFRTDPDMLGVNQAQSWLGTLWYAVLLQMNLVSMNLD